MIPGLGLLRRALTLVLMGAAFWAGLQAGRSDQVDACQDAGGRWNDRGYCEGVPP
jgi:hypothetical protein